MAIEWRTGATARDIEEWKDRIVRLLGDVEPPEELLALWARSDGFCGEEEVFYSLRESLDQNDLLEVAQFAPGHIAIANDGGSRVALVRSRDPRAEVLLSYMGDMKAQGMEHTGMSLSDWIGAGCPFDLVAPPQYSAAERVVLRLDRVPPGGIAGLMRLRKELHLEMPVTELKAVATKLPYDLCQLSYLRASRFATQFNRETVCISLWRASNPTEQLPVAPGL